MTLLVGAVFPWADLIDHLPIFGVTTQLGNPRSVIIAADSRWTHPDGRIEDGAVKVFGLGANGIMAYAGLSGAGENALGALALDLGPTSTMEEFTDTASRSIREATSADPIDGLEILVGFSNRKGGAALVRFSAIDNFNPRPTDFETIGSDVSCTYFRQATRSYFSDVRERSKNAAMGLGASPWAAFFMAIIHEIGKFGVDPKVGGPVTCGVTTGGESTGMGATLVSPTRDGIVATPIDLQGHGEGKTVRPGWKLVRPEDT